MIDIAKVRDGLIRYLRENFDIDGKAPTFKQLLSSGLAANSEEAHVIREAWNCNHDVYRVADKILTFKYWNSRELFLGLSGDLCRISGMRDKERKKSFVKNVLSRKNGFVKNILNL